MDVHAPHRSPWWPLPILVVASFLVFGPVLGLSPFSDDHSAVWNSGVRGIPWRNGFFRPLSDLTFRLGHLIWGTSAAGHRSFNVAVHGLNAFLLFLLFHRSTRGLDTGKARMGAWSGAVLFLVYPFHQESIVWLVGRESALGTCFVLLGLVVAGSKWSIPGRSIVLTLCLFTGALAYESALLLAPLALTMAWSGAVPGWPGPRQLLMAMLPGVLAYLAWRFTAVGIGGDSYLTGFLLQGVVGLLHHAPKAFARMFLPPDADPDHQLMKGMVLLALLLLLAALTWRALLHTPYRMRTLLTWSGLLLVSCVIPVLAGVSTNTSESDRFLYMPSAFLCGLVAYALQCIPDRLWRWSTTLVLLVASTFHLLRNHADWRQASVITRRVIAELPEIPRNGRLYVTGLPDAYQGAFIFRNGFPEAVWLAGKDGDRVVDVRPSAIGGDTAKGITILHRGVLVAPDPSDRWWHWNGEDHKPVSIPPRNADIR